VLHTAKSGQIFRWAILVTDDPTLNGSGPPCISESAAKDDAEFCIKIAIEEAKKELGKLLTYRRIQQQLSIY
jgi:hypothetical protein